jgi:hypothetical protein
MNDSPGEPQSRTRPVPHRHASPPLWLVATAYAALFLAGLYPVTAFGGRPYFPGPWESAESITAFFQARPGAVRLCAVLQFGAAIPLGIFAASIVSRLQFLGSRAAGVAIAFFGGITTAVTMMAAAIVLWVMSQPGIADNRSVLLTLYWLDLGFGGPGFSVPFGILAAGVTIPAAFMKLIPRWIAILGIAVAVCGELSWLYLIFPRALPLVPLTRFPGFVWIIAVGLAMPRSNGR